MAKKQKRHPGSARTYQDMKRKEAQQKQALTNEALLPNKSGGRKISLIGAVVMLAVWFALYFFTRLPLIPVLAIALICGAGSVFLMTYLSIRRNREKALREMKKK